MSEVNNTEAPFFKTTGDLIRDLLNALIYRTVTNINKKISTSPIAINLEGATDEHPNGMFKGIELEEGRGKEKSKFLEFELEGGNEVFVTAIFLRGTDLYILTYNDGNEDDYPVRADQMHHRDIIEIARIAEEW